MSSQILSHIDSYWQENADRFSLTLPLLGNPFSFLATVVSMFLISKHLSSYLSSYCKNTDLRPAMMIMNGLIFGLVGVGFVIGVILTRNGTDSFACDGLDPRNFDDIRVTEIKLIAFLYLLIKLMEFQRPFFAGLRGKSNSDHYNSFGYYFYLYGQLGMSYLGGTFYPGGVFCFWPLLDAFVTIASYAYLILQLASPELRPSPVSKTVINVMRYLTFLALAIHGYYFYLVPNCGNNFLLSLQAVYNTILVTAIAIRYFMAGTTTMKESEMTTLLSEANNNNIRKSKVM